MRSTITKVVATLIATAGVVSLTGSASNAAVDPGAREQVIISSELRGVNEVPGPGDPNGTGEFAAILTRGENNNRAAGGFDPGTMCYSWSADRIQDATAGHIHNGMEGDVGPVIITLIPPTEAGVSECITAVRNSQDDAVTMSRQELRALRQNPEFFYSNVHNGEYPDGAIRDQLRR